MGARWVVCADWYDQGRFALMQEQLRNVLSALRRQAAISLAAITLSNVNSSASY